MQQISLFEETDSRGATFSPCRKYRYTLWRSWEPDWQGNCVVYIALNPSTADENVNDPTVTRCINRAVQMDFGGMYMLNIFSYRATDPIDMKAKAEPVGEENDRRIVEICKNAKMIVCCWGNHGKHMKRSAKVRELLEQFKDKVYAIEVNSGGEPKHPLYCGYEKLPEPWSFKPAKPETRVFTLWQPWTEFMVDGYKKIETRGKAVSYRGPVFIHSAQRVYKAGSEEERIALRVIQQVGYSQYDIEARKYLGAPKKLFALPLGKVVLRCNLVDCIQMTKEFIAQQTELERLTGVWEEGRYALIFEDIQILERQLDFSGGQGLIKAPADLIAQVNEQIHRSARV